MKAISLMRIYLKGISWFLHDNNSSLDYKRRIKKDRKFANYTNYSMLNNYYIALTN